MSETPKPCPFCGSQPEQSPSVVGELVLCVQEGCAVQGKTHHIEAWNRRAPVAEGVGSGERVPDSDAVGLAKADLYETVAGEFQRNPFAVQKCRDALDAVCDAVRQDERTVACNEVIEKLGLERGICGDLPFRSAGQLAVIVDLCVRLKLKEQSPSGEQVTEEDLDIVRRELASMAHTNAYGPLKAALTRILSALSRPAPATSTASVVRVVADASMPVNEAVLTDGKTAVRFPINAVPSPVPEKK